MKKIIGTILLILTATGFIGLQILVLSRVLKQQDDLTLVSGRITAVEIIKTPKRYVGYNYAYGLKIDSSDLTYAIHENHRIAYEYISSNNVINNRLTILYDANDYNSPKDLTYHIYSVRIGNRTLLELKESRKTDKSGLIIFLLADIFIIWMIIFVYKKKQQSTTR